MRDFPARRETVQSDSSQFAPQDDCDEVSRYYTKDAGLRFDKYFIQEIILLNYCSLTESDSAFFALRMRKETSLSRDNFSFCITAFDLWYDFHWRIKSIK